MILTPKLHTETIQHNGNDVHGCIVQQARSTEPMTETGGVLLIEQLIVYVPAAHGSNITAYDELRVRGYMYRVEGQPLTERSAFTGDTGMTPVAVKRVTGG